jgi:hypothetical protein
MAFVQETGRPITEVGTDLGVNVGPLGNWLSASHEEHPDS